MNPIFFGVAILCAVIAIFAPPIINVLFVWMAYMYWKMSAQ